MKKLIIVCEERLRQYGDFLAQLISLRDDKDDGIIGTKDGTTAAQVWTESEYKSNSAQISSEQYILFIGNTKLLKEKRLHMKKNGKYGMVYSWLGKQAVIYVDEVVSLDDYDLFIDYAKKIQPEVKKLIELKQYEQLAYQKIKEVKNEVKFLEKVINPIRVIPNVLANAPILGANMFSKVVNNKKIEEQEYSCVVLEFYLNGLSTFLGLNE